MKDKTLVGATAVTVAHCLAVLAIPLLYPAHAMAKKKLRGELRAPMAEYHERVPQPGRIWKPYHI